MNQSIKLILYFILLGVFGFIIVNAADTESITATVTFQQISLSVTDGSVAYDVLAASGTKDTVSPSQSQTIENTGNVNEDFDIKGLGTTTGGTCTHWSLVDSATPGANEYSHEWSVNGGTGWDRFTSTYEEFASNKAPAGTATLDLRIKVPSSSDCFEAQAVDVTVQASAH
jgi:hypothetical protein